jgi:hypothetical protein
MLTSNFVNQDLFTVVDRRNLELLRQEMDFQLSGAVDDHAVQAIGKKLGAQSIISGKIEALGDMYRLQIHAIEVETAKVQGIQSVLIKRDPVLVSLTGKSAMPRLVNFVAGGSVGVKIGPGILFADIRYWGDFSGTKIEGSDFTLEPYRRSMLSFGIGYEIGLFTMRDNTGGVN